MEIRAVTQLNQTVQSGLETLSGDLPLDHALNVHREMPSYFQALEGETLVGGLTLFTPLPGTAEVSAFVRPDRRRRGVFAALLAEAEQTLRSYDFEELLFACSGDSPSGAAVAAHWGLALEHSEYRMAHGGARPLVPAERPPLTAADEADLPALVELSVAAFGDAPEEARSMCRKSVEAPAILCLVYRRGDRLAGVCNVNLEGEALSIFGLAVHPDFQGKGLGRAMLAALLDRLAAQWPGRPVTLEVDSTNDRAYRLYCTSGFTVTSRTDYYLRGL